MIMLHAVMVVRRHGRDLMGHDVNTVIHAGCDVRSLQACAGLPDCATGNQRHRNGPDQNMAKDPTHRTMLAEPNAPAQENARFIHTHGLTTQAL
jgi:hypothetical protein